MTSRCMWGPFPVPAEDTEAQGTGSPVLKEPLNLSSIPSLHFQPTLRVWVPTSAGHAPGILAHIQESLSAEKDALFVTVSLNPEFTETDNVFCTFLLMTLWLLFWGREIFTLRFYLNPHGLERSRKERGWKQRLRRGHRFQQGENEALVSSGGQAEWLPPRQNWFLSEQMVQLSSHHRSQPPHQILTCDSRNASTVWEFYYYLQLFLLCEP